ncbi:MAG TPA: Spy/CpxP family protein refolding chaperone [Tenuifilum sp.]|uniref:Spy/CpxP family protein refolding chaperone n=1 Tax=Tenuifilum sp. TaxID=2760880 RepID=UPI001B747508|nr:Spy/CpxP family protein refolding chaperone [Bacteroidales bacterium]HQG71648.1 Spy/CpxP family protein refolding chaperone [Tenuifilum sp.]HQI89912.1 Spy/CpxP family protein refolding chaperone [Tenuifilum sp.]
MKRIGNIMMAVLILTSTTGMAQGPRYRGGDGNSMQTAGKGYYYLNLTPEQEQKINDLRVKHLKEITPLRNELSEKQAHLRTLESADKPDMAAINKTIDEITSIKAKLMKARVAHRAEVSQLLTDEQRVLFNARGQKGKGMRGHRGNMRGGYGMGMGLGPCMGN